MVAATALAGSLNSYSAHAEDQHGGGRAHVEASVDHDHDASNSPGHLHIVVAQHDHEDGHELPCGDGACNGPVQHHHCVTVHSLCGGTPALPPSTVGLSPSSDRLARLSEVERALPSGQIPSPIYRPPRLLV